MMTLKEHLRRNISLAIPVMIGQLGHTLVNVADSVMVGRVGVIPLAGATFAGSIHSVLVLFGIGVSYAITPLVSSTQPDNRPCILSYLQNGLVLNIILGLILSFIGIAMSNFMHLFGQDGAVVNEARPYLIIMSSSLFPLMIFQTYRQFSEGLSDTMKPMIVSVVANLVNVALNYVLIYGHFGMPALGLSGAGYATLVARIIMFIMMVAMTRNKWGGFKWQLQFPVIKRLLKLGIPSGMQYVFEVGAFATSSIMVGWISAEALAAHNIALNLSAVTYMAATGIAAASTIRIGNQIGLKDKKNLRTAGFSAFGTVAVFMSFCGLLFVLLKEVLPGFYIKNDDVKLIASSLLVVAAAFQISDGLQAVGLGVLRGLTDVKVPTVVTFVCYWVIAVPCAYIFGFVLHLGANGVWYALLLGLTLAGALHIHRFNILSKKVIF